MVDRYLPGKFVGDGEDGGGAASGVDRLVVLMVPLLGGDDGEVQEDVGEAKHVVVSLSSSWSSGERQPER